MKLLTILSLVPITIFAAPLLVDDLIPIVNSINPNLDEILPTRKATEGDGLILTGGRMPDDPADDNFVTAVSYDFGANGPAHLTAMHKDD